MVPRKKRVDRWLWSRVFFLVPDYVGTLLLCSICYARTRLHVRFGEPRQLLRCDQGACEAMCGLPTLGVVFTETLAEVLVPAAMVCLVFRA